MPSLYRLACPRSIVRVSLPRRGASSIPTPAPTAIPARSPVARGCLLFIGLLSCGTVQWVACLNCATRVPRGPVHGFPARGVRFVAAPAPLALRVARCRGIQGIIAMVLRAWSGQRVDFGLHD